MTLVVKKPFGTPAKRVRVTEFESGSTPNSSQQGYWKVMGVTSRSQVPATHIGNLYQLSGC